MNRLVPTLSNALETISAVLKERAVTAMRGEAFTDDEPECIQAAREALRKLDPDPQTIVARLENEKKLALAGKAVRLAEALLQRNGFQEVKNVAWSAHDQQVVEDASRAFDRETAWQRG